MRDRAHNGPKTITRGQKSAHSNQPPLTARPIRPPRGYYQQELTDLQVRRIHLLKSFEQALRVMLLPTSDSLVRLATYHCRLGHVQRLRIA